MAKLKKSHIAQLLLEKEIVTQNQIDEALSLQKRSDKKLGEILIDLGYISEMDLLHILSQQLDIPFIDLNNYKIDPNTVQLLPEFYARSFRAIVLKKLDDSFLIGMVDPQNILAIEEIERVLKSKVQLGLIREGDLIDVLDNTYRRADEISQLAESLSAEIGFSETDTFDDTEDLSAEEAPVVSLLRSIFEDALQVKASDIHIEPDANVLRIRLRVDGALQEQVLDNITIAPALTQRLKLIAGLNIAEKRLPQDGRFSVKVKHKILDIRISTLPTEYGESVVMRLLDHSADLMDLNHIGMPHGILDYYRQVLTMTYGLVLIVGPTGSGKTTTLYASLNKLNQPEDKIFTVEDPVEYRLPRINQVQVNSKIDLTFANVLRSILRQDPDIIMIGELRDKDTVDIAFRAAMTGHFVLSTLHTNDTISSIPRLIDMGAEGYIVASILRTVIAQRLIRKICPKCIAPSQLTDEEQRWLSGIKQFDTSNVTFMRGQGCTYCHQSGYLGRLGVYEILPITLEMADTIRKEDIKAFTSLAAKQPLYQPLIISGLNLVKEGKSTVHEVIRMAGEV